MSKIIATIVVEPGDRVSVRKISRMVGFGYILNNEVIESGKVDIEVDSDVKYHITVNGFQYDPIHLEAGDNYFE